ncbi:MAG TPA: excinuclease ABC subunit UvrA [Bacteroidota bacterium]|nr:excinuclease ABC subunit UvrA [Bacteroidota bacterium]
MASDVTGTKKTARKKSAAAPAVAARDRLVVRGARVNNLKNISLEIPHDALVVITGVSGSGKSSLAFDTIYAEGQRRYVESLSAYARQFLERMNKPDVDFIQGIAPAIAIEQKTVARNPRSTVGTTTEVYDYLRLLYARIGKTWCRNDEQLVQRDSVRTVLERCAALPDGSKLYITFPMHEHSGHSIDDEFDNLRKQGFVRVVIDGDIVDIQERNPSGVTKDAVYVLVDRVVWRGMDNVSRMTDSLETAFLEGDGHLRLFLIDSKETVDFSTTYACAQCGTAYMEPDPQLFSFNAPTGACPLCQGFGRTTGIDPNLVIPNVGKTLAEGAVQPWTTPKHSKHQRDMVKIASSAGLPLNTPWRELTDEQRALVWNGCKGFLGVRGFFDMLEQNNYKMHYRILIARYRGFTICPACGGSRLQPDALAVRVAGKTLGELTRMPLERLRAFFDQAEFTAFEQDVAERLLAEIRKRLRILHEIGLGYLTLDRLSHTLSGGEAQRINIATSLGSSLVGTLYVLDEPTIGLHPRDNSRLIGILQSLRDSGNTVLVVEHDAEMMQVADMIVDIGPAAGENGGSVVAIGTPEQLRKNKASLTGQYLSGKLTIPVPTKRRSSKALLTVHDVRQHNLQGFDVSIPLGVLTCITGVSGSGKSTLVHDIIYGGLRKELEGAYEGEVGYFSGFAGEKRIKHVEMVDQSPIGRSPRSNPVTYIKAFDAIRDLFASTAAARLRGLGPGAFSFNVPGGRCDVCEGDGAIKVEMQFMADLYLECESCKGSRYKREILDIRFNGKNIVDVLNMTVTEALAFFSHVPRVANKLQILDDVGLGYMRLGQAATTLSGGEAQRLKLAVHLSNKDDGHTLFIFDEPTTGLHIHDIGKLLRCFQALIDNGHSVLIIEHNLDVIKCADWIIDLGPEGGEHGGRLIASGTPEHVAAIKDSHTGRYLATILPSTRRAR